MATASAVIGPSVGCGSRVLSMVLQYCTVCIRVLEYYVEVLSTDVQTHVLHTAIQ